MSLLSTGPWVCQTDQASLYRKLPQPGITNLGITNLDAYLGKWAMNRKVLLSVNSSEGVGVGESGRMFGFCFISRKDGHCFLEAALGSRRGEWERFISLCQSSIIQLEYLKSITFLAKFPRDTFF